ncbi:MAG: hypothetical protein ABEJ56_00335 [Candidatus Nanohaloarchaea archaeon]
MVEITEEFVENRVEELKKRDDVRAVGIVGSYARDPDGDHNDLDIYIIVEGEWRKRVTEKVDNVTIEKFFNSLKWAKHYFERKKDSWYMVRWMENIDIRYDRDNAFDEVIEVAEQEKKEFGISESEKNRILYNIWDRQKDLEKMDDVGQKRYSMHELLDYLLEIIYRKKEVVPVKDNYRIEKLQEFDGYMYKLAQEFLTSSSTLEKERKLEKMIDHVTKGIGQPHPEWETEREKFED